MSPPLHVLLIDNFDSFSFNLADELSKRGAQVQVWRNDVAAERALELALALPTPRLVVLSPGPGAPADAGCCVELSRRAAGRLPLFGVCLGHQAIVEAFGGEVGYAGEVVHGKATALAHDGAGVFEGLPTPMMVARYHSLVATQVPDALNVSARCKRGSAGGQNGGDDEPAERALVDDARDDDALVMAVRHRQHAIAGVQFHPESILTPYGGSLWEGVMHWAVKHSGEKHSAAKHSVGTHAGGGHDD